MKLETNELQGSCHHSKRPWCPHSLEILIPPPTNDWNVTPGINSQHEGRTESPVAHLEIAPDPYLISIGGLTTRFQLEREAEFHAPRRDDI